MRRDDISYHQEFGHIPDDTVERMKYILGKRYEDPKVNTKIHQEVKRIKRIKWIKFSFTMWKIFRPSARPRVNTRRGYPQIYVPGAKKEGDWFESFAKEHNLPFIETPCIINIDVYEKTPTSFSILRTALAELGMIRPWKRTGDIDNYAKALFDSIQHGMLLNDSLIIQSSQALYYSIKPRAHVKVLYMERFPD